jgi:hypothetical protein
MEDTLDLIEESELNRDIKTLVEFALRLFQGDFEASIMEEGLMPCCVFLVVLIWIN